MWVSSTTSTVHDLRSCEPKRRFILNSIGPGLTLRAETVGDQTTGDLPVETCTGLEKAPASGLDYTPARLLGKKPWLETILDWNKVMKHQISEVNMC